MPSCISKAQDDLAIGLLSFRKRQDMFSTAFKFTSRKLQYAHSVKPNCIALAFQLQDAFSSVAFLTVLTAFNMFFTTTITKPRFYFNSVKDEQWFWLRAAVVLCFACALFQAAWMLPEKNLTSWHIQFRAVGAATVMPWWTVPWQGYSVRTYMNAQINNE